MDRSTLIEEASQLLEHPLHDLGYFLQIHPPVTGYQFWFEKKPDEKMSLYWIIEFQLSGFDRNNLFELVVNLGRRPYRDFNDSRNYQRKYPAGFHVRLAPCLWETELEKRAMDKWWHFNDSIDELHAGYTDILDKLINYGIPFLDNPASTWWTWAGKEPPT